MGVCAGFGRLEVYITHLDGIPVVEARGECDIATAPALQKRIEGLLGQGRVQLILDIRGLQYIDSAGLNLIIRIRNQAARRDGTVVILDHTEPVRRVLKLLQFDRLVTIVGSHLEALAYLKGETVAS